MAIKISEQIKPLTRDAVRALAKLDGQSIVTLTMPTHQAGSETRQDPIRFKNLLRKVEKWVESGLVEEQVQERLQELDQENFWQQQSAGLAIVDDGQTATCYRCSERLDEAVDLAAAPKLTSFVPRFGSVDGVLVLFLTWDRADMQSLAEDGEMKRVGEFPHTLEELVTLSDPEEQLQFSTHKSKGKGSGETVMFHGQGEGEQQVEAERLQFFSRISELVSQQLYNTSLPLLVVGTDEVIGHFEAQSKIKSDIQSRISPASLSEHELQNRVRAEVDSWAAKSLEDAEAQYALAASEQRVVADTGEIASMAMQGRIEKIYFRNGAELRGEIDLEKQSVTLTSDGEDELINFAVVHALRNGGEVYRFRDEKLPGGADKFVAILRY